MRAHLAFPGDLSTPTGGYVYDRRVIEASGGAIAPLSLPATFPAPSDGDVAAALDALRACDGPTLVDGLAYGVLPADALAALPRAPLALCHHPLGLEPGLDDAKARRLAEAERAALGAAAHVVVTSATTKATLVAAFGVAPDDVTVVEPGLDRAPAAAPAPDDPIILTVASLTQRKAHDVLVDALALIAGRPWRAVWAGPEDRDPDWTRAIEARIHAAGLASRIERRGAVDQNALDELYGAASLFCLPSRYEGYGMVFAEAMRRGLPVVACAAGATPETAPRAAGALVPPDDPAALAAALGRFLDDASARETAGAAGRTHALRLADWPAASARIVRLLERFA